MRRNSFINSSIRRQEQLDYFVASRVLKDNFNSSHMTVETYPTPESCYVDMYGVTRYNTGQEVRFNVEIKERNKSLQYIQDSPFAELKVSKYNRMRSVTEKGVKLYYMVLLNGQTCLLYDLDNPEVWKNVEIREWEMKRTQFSDNSDKVIVDTYFIPYANATFTADCTSIYKDWYINGLDKEDKDKKGL